jgi:hypothetical protein
MLGLAGSKLFEPGIGSVFTDGGVDDDLSIRDAVKDAVVCHSQPVAGHFEFTQTFDAAFALQLGLVAQHRLNGIQNLHLNMPRQAFQRRLGSISELDAELHSPDISPWMAIFQQ